MMKSARPTSSTGQLFANQSMAAIVRERLIISTGVHTPTGLKSTLVLGFRSGAGRTERQVNVRSAAKPVGHADAKRLLRSVVVSLTLAALFLSGCGGSEGSDQRAASLVATEAGTKSVGRGVENSSPDVGPSTPGAAADQGTTVPPSATTPSTTQATTPSTVVSDESGGSSEPAPTSAPVDPAPTTEPAESTPAPEPADVPVAPVSAAERVPVGQQYRPFAVFETVTLVHPSNRVERIGFHESNHDGARQMEPTDQAVGPLVLDSRGRGTGSRTAADIVVEPGTEIRAPVTGTVVRAGGYVLYCDHRDDFAVIEPDARPGWEVKVLHISGVLVSAGDRVEAGVTVLAPEATILPFDSQVDEFTAEPSWPHVHIELVDPSIPDRPSTGGGC